MSPYHHRQSTQRRATLETRAHYLRTNPTPSEALLWSALSASRLGLPFRRQAVIGHYIADFLCRPARLVVEVDGGIHAARTHLDALRDAALRRAGYRILRVPASLAATNLAAAVGLIRAALEAPR